MPVGLVSGTCMRLSCQRAMPVVHLGDYHASGPCQLYMYAIIVPAAMPVVHLGDYHASGPCQWYMYAIIMPAGHASGTLR